MPPVEEITQLLQGTYINYFHCGIIVDLLKGTDDGSKNIFGMYSSQRMKDWLEIVKLYEKDGTYLAEAAQLLMRNVNYEIPALKKQISKCQQYQSESTRKEAEHATNAKELREKFYISCKQMGIEGKKVKSELMDLARDLPVTCDNIARRSANIGAACDYYTEFVSFTLDKNEFTEDSLCLLKHVMAMGNTTVYEWRTGRKPTRVEEIKLDFRIEDEEIDQGEDIAEEIDWGDIEAGGDSIDFGDDCADLGPSEEIGAEIDWGSGEPVAIDILDDSTGGAQIIEEEGVAKGIDARTILDDTDSRNSFIDELVELESFLSQRLSEMRSESSVISSSVFQTAPKSIQVSPENVEGMLFAVQEILTQLTTKRLQDLFMIRNSPRYVNRVGDNLKKILSDSEKLVASSRLMVTKRTEALQEQKETEPKLDLIRVRTKEMKTQLECEISKKYKDRRVNIMGEINTI